MECDKCGQKMKWADLTPMQGAEGTVYMDAYDCQICGRQYFPTSMADEYYKRQKKLEKLLGAH
jgi:methionyl-tRNA synthetase